MVVLIVSDEFLAMILAVLPVVEHLRFSVHVNALSARGVVLSIGELAGVPACYCTSV
jgi:hypothetical protein